MSFSVFSEDYNVVSTNVALCIDFNSGKVVPVKADKTIARIFQCSPEQTTIDRHFWLEVFNIIQKYFSEIRIYGVSITCLQIAHMHV